MPPLHTPGRPRSIACLGGGPAGLYLALLLKRNDPARQVTVFERNRADDTFGFGVIFSDATLESFQAADTASHALIRAASVHWNELEVFARGEHMVSSGHGFAGLGRRRMLAILQARCEALGVELRFGVEPAAATLLSDHDLVVAADGVQSKTRDTFTEAFGPSVELRPNRFIWLGSTQQLSSFTFYFDENAHGLFRVHAYRYDDSHSTFIVECTEQTFARTGLHPADEAGAVAYCQALFAHRLEGHQLLTRRSSWRRFPTVRNERWHSGKLVLLGDAAHTAHFSIGSGTKMAIDDAIALAAALEREDDVGIALTSYEAERRPAVEKLQQAAEVSLAWFEDTERYFHGLDPLSFTYSLLTRSLRIDHDKLRQRDRALVDRVDAAFAARAGAVHGARPLLTPLSLGSLRLANRIALPAGHALAAAAGLVVVEQLSEDLARFRTEAGRAVIALVIGGADRTALLDGVRRALALEVQLPLVAVGPDAAGDFAAARALWPPERALGARLVASARAGAATVEAARALAASGCALIDLVPGALALGLLLPLAERVRLEAGIAVMTRGELRSAGEIDAVLAGGRADLCFLSNAQLVEGILAERRP